ncbi:MAG: hypothetical protein ACJ72S_01630, partial [Nitrososphaeraceae archaeon]
MPTILPLLAVRKVDISMLIATVVARLPKIIEDTLIAIPINSNTTVIVHAHVFPLIIQKIQQDIQFLLLI